MGVAGDSGVLVDTREGGVMSVDVVSDFSSKGGSWVGIGVDGCAAAFHT